MSRSFECIIPFSVRCTSRGECQLVTVHHAVFPTMTKSERKSTFRVGSKVLQTSVGEEFDSKAMSFIEQTLSDGIAGVAARKYTAFIFYFEGHPMQFPPFVDVAWGEGAEESLHQTRSARIHVLELVDALEGVGDIATSASSGAHLSQRLAGTLHKSDVRGRGDFTKRDGEEKARSTSTDNIDVRH